MTSVMGLVSTNRELALNGMANAAGQTRAENLQKQQIEGEQNANSRMMALSGAGAIGVGIFTGNPLAIASGVAGLIGAFA